MGHFNPDDHYEALVERLVERGCSWLDVGCGRNLFPSNERLARMLADRCGLLVGVDPDPTLLENPFVHLKVRVGLEDFEPETSFDLVTMRMVAEHVKDPERLAKTLSRCAAAGGRVVVYTVNRFSPVPIITSAVPFSLHHPAKRILWGTESKDTFPTYFRMNTRRRLRKIFESAGFHEDFFAYLDDCRTTGAFRLLQWLELAAWRTLRILGLHYPENCLLGVYRKS
jgi:SAM-dependent methyltransferase